MNTVLRTNGTVQNSNNNDRITNREVKNSNDEVKLDKRNFWSLKKRFSLSVILVFPGWTPARIAVF